MDRHTALNILSQVRQASTEKQGDAILDAAREQASSGLKWDAAKDVGKLALFGLGVGAAGRGAMGLYNVLKRNMSPEPAPTTHMAVLPLPVPADEQRKTAGFLSGDYAVDKVDLPWYRPAMLLGSLAGIYGGWKGVDAVLDKRRKAEMDEEMEKARGDFSNALLTGYQRPISLKAAEDDLMTKIGNDLDQLYAAMEKQGLLGMENLVPDMSTLSRLTGNYATYAVPSALFAGMATYRLGSKSHRANVIRKAIEQRAAKRQAVRPAELFARPVPVEYRNGQIMPEDEEG